ncbi:MAG: RHS repeat-associated core domain-containing protein, partial [Acidimicrobiales bacterium]
GVALSALPDNSAGNLDYGWLGSHLRPLEHAPGLATIELGARPYVPGIGRFLSVDPVEGGSANDYDYVNSDPCNSVDLDGRVPVLVAVAAAAAVASIPAAYKGYKCMKSYRKFASFVKRQAAWADRHNARVDATQRGRFIDTSTLFNEYISISGYWHDLQYDCTEAVAGIFKRGIKAK